MGLAGVPVESGLIQPADLAWLLVHGVRKWSCLWVPSVQAPQVVTYRPCLSAPFACQNQDNSSVTCCMTFDSLGDVVTGLVVTNSILKFVQFVGFIPL